MKVKQRQLVFLGLIILILISFSTYFSLPNKRFVRYGRRLHTALTNSLCNHNSEFYIRQHGSYFIMYNYIVAMRNYTGNESVTLALHGEYNDLKALNGIVRRWRGPVSLTLFTNGLDFNRAQEVIKYLIRCEIYGEIIRNYVTFHFLIHEDHFPSLIPRSEEEFFYHQANCMRNPFEQYINQTYRQEYNLSYPINMARNIARQAVLTYYVLAIDMDYLTTVKFPQLFLNITPELNVPNPLKTVFVLPVVEASQGAVLPESKHELKTYNESQYMPSSKEYMPFMHEWFNHKEKEHVFVIRRHVGLWQPWYVSVNKYEPLADERYTEETHLHRIVQIDLLEMLHYDFVVLNNAFLVHQKLPSQLSNATLNQVENYAEGDKSQLKHRQQLLILKNFLMNFM